MSINLVGQRTLALDWLRFARGCEDFRPQTEGRLIAKVAQLQPCCSPRVHTPSYVLTLETEMPVMREYDGTCGRGPRDATSRSITNSPKSLSLQAADPAKMAPVAILLQVRTVCLSTVDSEGFVSDEWSDQ